jgi:hypothetical protein
MHRPHHGVPEAGLVDEQIRLGDLGDAQLDVSSPMGVTEIVLPTATGPEISIRAMSPFQSGHVATSDQRRQIASGEAVVAMLCSMVHITGLPRPGRAPAHLAG